MPSCNRPRSHYPFVAELHLAARIVRHRLRSRPEPTLRAILGVGRCGNAHIRPIEAGDREAWRAAMLANFDRMALWWSIYPDRNRATDNLAFLQHRREWEGRLDRGEGACLGIIGPDGLMSEVQLWHLHPRGLTCELGLWASPVSAVSGKEWVGCLAQVFDRLFRDVGIQRIEAPVAVGNEMPRPVLALMGFQHEASLRQWRELHGELIDYDLLALTPQRWGVARPHVLAKIGGWSQEGTPHKPRRNGRRHGKTRRGD